MTAPRLQLGFAGVDGTPDWHLSVDGMTPRGPNLSHWPGNRTPAKWKADLSTGICLQFARAGTAEQDAFLQGATVVLNDHYDTDGFGSLVAVLRPELAFAHEELLLAAAATGDFSTYGTWRGFAIDRIVANLAAPHSPMRERFAGLAGPNKSFARYRWLLEHAEELLREPQRFAPLYEAELARVTESLHACRNGALTRRLHPQVGLAVVETREPVPRIVLNTLAGAWRVLHGVHTREGTHWRFHDRTESWFELATFHALPRRDLRPLAETLRALEPARDGLQWCVDASTEPIPELYFGAPSTQEYGQVSRTVAPSRLDARTIEAAFVAFFEARGAT